MNKIILLSVLLILASCSKKDAGTPATLKLLSSAITSGVSITGGAIITGRSSTGDTFQLGLQTGNEESEILLSPGTWDFAAITWENENAFGPLTGKNRCAFTSTVIGSNEVVVDLSLSPENCVNPVFSKPENLTGNQFKDLRLVACSNLYGIGVATDSCSDTPFEQGNNLSYRIYFPGQQSNSEAPLSGLSSACITSPDLNQSDYLTQYKIPLNDSGSFPFSILAYESTDCAEEELEATYLFQIASPGGVLNTQSDHLAYSDAGNVISFFFADNYLGIGGNTFANSGMLLPSQNFSYRYDDPIDSSGTGDNYDNTRKIFNDIVGTSNQTTPWALGAKAIAVIYDGAPDKIITIESNNKTSAYNNLTFNFSNTGSVCLVNTSYDSALKAFTLNYCTNTPIGVSTTTNDVILSLSEAMTTAGLISEFTITNGRVSGNLSGSIQPMAVLMNGQNSENSWKRNTGLYGEIAKSYYGHLGAMLFKAGFEICSEIPEVGSKVFAVKGHGEVELRFSKGKIPMSTWMNNFGAAENPNIFEKRVGFYEEGQMKEFYEFNCSGNVYAGYFRSNDVDGDGDYRISAYYDAQNSDNLKFEFINYDNQTYAGNETQRKQWSYLINDNTIQEVKLRTIRYYNNITTSDVQGDVYAAKINSTEILTSAKHFSEANLNTLVIDFETGLNSSKDYNYDGSDAMTSIGFGEYFEISPSNLAMNTYQFPKLIDAIPNNLPPMTMNDPRLFEDFGPNITYQIYNRTMNFFDDWNSQLNSSAGCFYDENNAQDFLLGDGTSLFPSAINRVYANDFDSVFTELISFVDGYGCTGVKWDTKFSDISINPLSIKNYDQSVAPSLDSLDAGTIFEVSLPTKILGTPQTFTNTLVTTIEPLGSGLNKGSLRLLGNQIYRPINISPLPTVVTGTSIDFSLSVIGVYPGAILSTVGTTAPTCTFSIDHTMISCLSSGLAPASGETWDLIIDNPNLTRSQVISTTIVP